MVERIELKDPTGFAMYAVYHNIARKLELKDTLADAIAKSESLQKTVRDKNIKLSFAFVLKKSLFLEIKTSFPDPVERDLVLSQVSLMLRDVL